MIAAVTYLTLTSARNRWARMAARLKQPRYAMGFIIGLTYLWFFLLRNGGRSGQSTGLGAIPPQYQLLLAFVLFLYLASAWLIGQDRSALALTPAEIQFLLPAPISRRAVLHFKLVRTQIGVLVATLIWGLILRRAGGGIDSARRAISLWLLFSTISMHRLAATLVRVASTEHGTAGARRNALPMALFLGVIAVLGVSIVSAGPSFAEAHGLMATIRTLGTVLQEPRPHRILSPVMLLLAPLFAPTAAVWLHALWPALLILALHYAWVARSNVAFEEAATEASAKMATRMAARRSRGRQAPPPTSTTARFRLPLAPTGFPATAIVWKNCVAYLRALGPQSFVMVVVLTIMASSIAVARPYNNTASLLRIALPLLAVVLVVFGGRMVRNDLRQDLANLPLLKSFPLDGSLIVGAEIAASTTVLTVVQGALLVLWAFLFGGRFSLPPGMASYATAALIGTPFVLVLVNAVNMTVLNAAALLFPGWMRFGPGGAAGVEAIGQGLLTMVGSLLILAISLVPAILVGGIIVVTARPSLGDWSVLPGLVAALATLAGELALAIRGLGVVFDRTDPSEVT